MFHIQKDRFIYNNKGVTSLQITYIRQFCARPDLFTQIHWHSHIIKCLTSDEHLLLTIRCIEDEQEIIYPTSSTMNAIVTRQNPLCCLSVSLPNAARRTTAERQVRVNE